MKKTIIVIILAIYVASIFAVNFFGLEVKIFDGTDYVESIQVDTVTLQNENAVEIEPSQYINKVPLFIFDFTPSEDPDGYTAEDESILTNPNVIQINYEVLPHLADDAEVRFEFDDEAMEGFVVYHEASRSLIFLKPDRIFTFTIKALDGSNVSAQVSIMGTMPE